MHAFKNNRPAALLFYFTTFLLVFHDAVFSLAQAADDPSGKTVQEKQSKTSPQVRMGKTEGIEKAPRWEDDRSWFSRNKWWVALSVMLTGGLTAAAASTGGNNGGSGDNGSYYFEW